MGALIDQPRELLSLKEAAQILRCRPRDISDEKYSGLLDAGLFQRIGNLTVVRRESLDEMRRVLGGLGKLRYRA